MQQFIDRRGDRPFRTPILVAKNSQCDFFSQSELIFAFYKRSSKGSRLSGGVATFGAYQTGETSMMNRLRRTCIYVRPAVPEDLRAIHALWLRHGEGNVDIRDASKLEAVHSGGLHTFWTDYGQLVATGGCYPYKMGKFTELGSSCWHPGFRNRGGATISVCFRAVFGSMTEPGTIITSELYETSRKSEQLLKKLNFQESRFVPEAMHCHAFEANPVEPVKHMLLAPWLMPRPARILLGMIEGDETSGGLSFNFDAYRLDHIGIRSQIEQLALGDMSMIGHEHVEEIDLQSWLAVYASEVLIDYETFITQLRMKD